MNNSILSVKNAISNAANNILNATRSLVESKVTEISSKNSTSSQSYTRCGNMAVSASELEEFGWCDVTFESVKSLNQTLNKYNIITKEEISHFLAQCAYEGDWGRGVIEYGDDDYLRSLDYYPYYGAGYIQVSTEGNYELFSKDMNDPLIYNGEGSPEYVAANYAWEAAGWWWDTACINQKIQEGYTVDQVSGTVIYWDKDGPDNGSYEQRRKNYNKIYNILK